MAYIAYIAPVFERVFDVRVPFPRVLRNCYANLAISLVFQVTLYEKLEILSFSRENSYKLKKMAPK